MNLRKNTTFRVSVYPVFVLPGFLTVFLMVAGCGTSRKAAVPHVSMDRQQYIQKYAGLAIEEMNRAGIPASIIMAQALLESDNGNSYLAVHGNNHFGIKCHRDWTGKRIRFDDDKKHECFRKYRSVEESYRDHSDFIRKGQRYAFLFSLDPEDYKSWARGLKKAGYATNPHYDKMLIRIIEDNKLYELDDREDGTSLKPMKRKQTGSGQKNGEKGKKEKAVLQPPQMPDEFTVASPSRKIMTNNRINYIIVRPGDTFESLTKQLQMLSWELPKYNDLPRDAKLTPGQILYLQPKRRQAQAGNNIYTVKEGDTLYSISQKFGIKMKYLREMNSLKSGQEPVPGQKIRLRR